MSDSFFTSRNGIDPQLTHVPVQFCDDLLSASSRRLIKLEGPLETAKRLQRLADICAGAYVLPIEHWRKSEPVTSPAPPPPPAPTPSRVVRIHDGLARRPLFMFWLGFITHAILLALS